MRHITIVGVDPESETVECEIAGSDERVLLPLDARLRAAARGEFLAAGAAEDLDSGAAAGADTGADADSAAAGPETADPVAPSAAATDIATTDGAAADGTAAAHASPSATDTAGADQPAPRADHVRLRPKEIQERVRMGATVDELVELTGFSRNRVEAFAYPILQERAARAEKARTAHPLLGDGPAVETVEDKTLASLEQRGIDAETVRWDAWKLKNGNWVLEASWPAGLSDDATATWECVPDSHGGVARPLDDEARAIGDPALRRGLESVDGSVPPYQTGFPPQGGPQQAFGGHQGHPGHQPHVSNLYAVPRHGGHADQALPHDPTTQPEPYVIGRPVDITQPRTAAPTPQSPAGSAPIEMGPGTGTAGARTGETGAAQPAESAGPDAENREDEDFLLHPPAEGPQKAKGKHPTMPSWEDVLLGVRSPKD